jgi:hypothetical protein
MDFWSGILFILTTLYHKEGKSKYDEKLVKLNDEIWSEKVDFFFGNCVKL